MKKCSLLLLCLGQAAWAQTPANPAAETGENPPLTPASQSGSTEYVGDNIRIGIGWDSEFDLTGELLWVFQEDSDSSWIGEGWFADGAAGGVKLNYHWLGNAEPVGNDAQGNPIYQDGRIYKTFLAADQNEFDDRKLSFGGGVEYENIFWSLYGSKSISGRRDITTFTTSVEQIVNGVLDNHSFTRTDTLQTVTDVYAHPYEWGVGLRFGGYLVDHSVRLRGGVDFEDGKFGADQTTFSASLDKYFKGGHGLSFRVAYADKSGRFEVDRSDLRGGVFYTYDFGGSYRPTEIYENRQFEVPAPDETVTRSKVVSHQVKIESRTQFDLDKAVLKPAALDVLDEIAEKIKGLEVISSIRIVGHTCDLASEQYNLDLSNRRARSVADYLIGKGIPEQRLAISAVGESQPKYPNDGEENRSKNRRVEIEFLTVQEDTQEIQVAAEPTVEWRQVEVPREAAWIRRALRNPVRHKRQVDYYRVEESTTTLIEGDPEFENTGPDAVDDQFDIVRDSAATSFNVLDNDSDSEGDGLTISTTTPPGNGTIAVVGDIINYTPSPGFVGLDSFTYTIEDGFGGSDSATVTVRVSAPNTAPQAVNDQAQAEQDTPVTIDVLANDSDPDGDTLSVIEVSSPANGSASISGGQVVYTPAPGFVGDDSFTYTVDDGAGGAATAQVNVSVLSTNNPPVANPDQVDVNKNDVAIIDVLANDEDPDGDPLTVVGITLSDDPKGTVTINPDGTVTYTPNLNWYGGDEFTYTISDGRGGTASALVTLRVINN